MTEGPSLAAESFFDEVLPSVIKSREAAFRTLSGTICFMVHDLGDWTIELGNTKGEAVRKEARFDADLVAGFSRETFALFMAGEQIEAEKGCYFHGDLELLAKFGRLLLPPARGVVGLLGDESARPRKPSHRTRRKRG